MNRRPLLFAALGFLVLLALTLTLIRPADEPDRGSFFTLKEQIPDTLTVVYGPDSTILVPGGRTGWTLVYPVRAPADGVVVDAMRRRLLELDAERVYPLTPRKMDTYGMRISRARVYAMYGDGLSPDTLTIGSFTMNDAFDYGRRNSDLEVGVLDARIVRTFLLKRTLDLRDTQLLPFAESLVDTLELFDAEERMALRLVSDASGIWRQTHPYAAPVRGSKVTNYLRSLNHMNIHRFMTEDANFSWEGTGLMAPSARLRLVARSGHVLGLRIGARIPDDPELHFAVTQAEDRLVGVSPTYLTALQKGPADFLEPVQFPFGLEAVDTVWVVQGDSTRFLWARRGGGVELLWDALGNWVLLEAQQFETTSGPLAGKVGELRWVGNGDLLAAVEVGAAREGRRPLRVAAGRHARAGEVLWVPDSRAGPLWDYFVAQALK